MENHHHHDQHHPGHEPDEAALAELLDLDAEVLHSYLSGVIDWVGELAGGQPRRILDLGTGTGNGALVLAWVFAALRPGGLLAVAELDSFPRFLPDDIGAGLEARLHAALAEARAGELPHLHSDWGPRLSAAGFTIEARRTFDIDLAAPLPALAGRYAQASLTRLRSGLDGRLSASDLATLGPLLDSDGPDSVLRRDDLTIRAARTAWAARRP
jgi:hypothetical protein